MPSEPDGEWKNIFQLWEATGKSLPLVVVKNTWSAEAGHYLIVTRITIKKWPYGFAWGEYYWATEWQGAESQRRRDLQLENPAAISSDLTGTY